MQRNEQKFSATVSGNTEIHLRDYIAVIKKRNATIITFLILTVLFVTIASFSMTPLYTASSQVLIEKNLGENSIENTYSSRRYDPTFLETHFKIITSFNVIQRVVHQLQLDTKYKSYFLKEGSSQFFFFKKSLKQKIIVLLQSFSSQDALLPQETSDDADLFNKTEPISASEQIVEIIKDNLSIAPERDTKIVNITYSHQVPGMAKLITDSLIVAYKVELQEIKHSSSNDTLKWMTEKAEQERRKLEE